MFSLERETETNSIPSPYPETLLVTLQTIKLMYRFWKTFHRLNIRNYIPESVAPFSLIFFNLLENYNSKEK